MIKLTESTCFSFSKSKDKLNQDAMLEPKSVAGGILFAAADGVGSYKGAELASSLAIEHLRELDSKNSILNLSNLFSDILEKIIRISRFDSECERASTTLTYCFLTEYELHIGHIGDCRAYVKQGSKLIQLTKDHTIHQKYLDEGEFTKAQLKNVKGKNTITTAISQVVSMKPDHHRLSLNDLELENGSISLYIMSDGAHSFWESLPRFSESTMKSVIKMGASLQKRIERKGPIDDYTFVGCKIQLKDDIFTI